MKAFVTGGTGFIGKRVVQRLLERGYNVTCLVRGPERATGLRELDVTLVQGDITDPESMRQGMTGADIVFHMAAWYEIGVPSSALNRMERINVDGTENVLGLAVELGVPKIVYTSTSTVLGDTYGLIVDETYRRDSPFDSAYDRTKWQAHQVAERYIAKGAPIIIVMPAQVYGPNDHSVIGTFLRLYLRRLLPVMPGADTGFSLVYVDDVAEGHLLAAEEGKFGESYILGGDVITVGDAFQVIARLAGIPAPLLLLDSRLLIPLRPLTEWLEELVPLPSILCSEILHSLGRTWWSTSAKAEHELGYTHRSIEEGMAETVLWEVAQLRDRPAAMQSGILLALTIVIISLGMLLLLRRRKLA